MNARRFRRLHRARCEAALLTCVALTATSHAANVQTPGFQPQTGLIALEHPNYGSVVALAGRQADATPRLGLIHYEEGGVRFREWSLPDGTAAVDVGPDSSGGDALFVLTDNAVHRVYARGTGLEHWHDTKSVFRGRSFAELTRRIDFVRSLADLRVPFLTVPDFDVVHIVRANVTQTVPWPAYRRSYDANVSYQPLTLATAALPGGTRVYMVRGDTLHSFDLDDAITNQARLPLGLSSELERESIYNSYEDIDQQDSVLREVDQFTDINGDGLPDILTLETISAGVFDKTTTYQIYHGTLADGELTFPAVPETRLANRGFQFGARLLPLDDGRHILVTASVRVGVGTLISALFSRSVTMQVRIYPPDLAGNIPSEPATTIKSKIEFDFGSGETDFPTIAFGDLDGDGVQDLVLKGRKRGLAWRRGLEDNQFASRPTSLDIVGPADGTQLVLTDLDNDGRDDIVLAYGRADGDRAGQLVVHMTR
ncbi:MAG: VCBS repeat-containing protein [Pseudomonadota bacterium]